jgi:hypothetical protein
MQAVMTSDKRWILTSMRIKWLIKYKDDCLNIKKKQKKKKTIVVEETQKEAVPVRFEFVKVLTLKKS